MYSQLQAHFQLSISVCSFCLNHHALDLLTLFIQNRLPYCLFSPNLLPIGSINPCILCWPGRRSSHALHWLLSTVPPAPGWKLREVPTGLTWLGILTVLAEGLTRRQSLVSKLQRCLRSSSMASFPGAFCDPKTSNKNSRR